MKSQIAQHIIDETPERIRRKVKKYGKDLVMASYFLKLVGYSEQYEINFQMWPNQYTIYISKDGIDLSSFSGEDEIHSMSMALKYLDRVNKIKPK